jgi:polyisoprenoid-binding protein YceI
MEAANWVLDPTHSEVHFKIKHLMITNVTGQFQVVQATVKSDDDDFTNAQISFTADVATIHTANEQRDAHLVGADFFDVEKFPHIQFTASQFNATSGKLAGDLTIKGITKPVELDVEFAGVNKDPWGNTKAGFSLSGKINRKDWDLTWNATLESGGLLVSEEVKILAEIQFVKQA